MCRSCPAGHALRTTSRAGLCMAAPGQARAGLVVSAALEVGLPLPGSDLPPVRFPLEPLGRTEELHQLAAKGGHDDVVLLERVQGFSQGSWERFGHAVRTAAESVLDLLQG